MGDLGALLDVPRAGSTLNVQILAMNMLASMLGPSVYW